MGKSGKPVSRAMQAVWAGAIFFLLGYFPTMLIGFPTMSKGLPVYSILAAAIGSVPYGMKLCSSLRGMLGGLWLGAIAGLATFLALTHLMSMAEQSQMAATAAATASASAPATTSAPVTAPAALPAASASKPVGLATSRPTDALGKRNLTREELGLRLLGFCLISQMVVCSAICASAGWLAKRRKKLIDRQWDEGKDK